jgi:hypothetical protein
MKKIIFMLLAVAVLTGCSKFEQVPNDESGSPVELSGDIYTGAATRGDVGDGVIGGIPDPNGLKFDLYRANQNPSAVYSAYTLRVNGTLGTDKKITTEPATLYYLGNGKSSSFIGLYPRGGDLDANTVTYPVNGATDILATQSVEGDKVSKPTHKFLFKHLLTKIRVEIKVEGTDTEGLVNMLGDVKVEIKDKAVNAVVALPDLSTSTNATGVYPTVAADGTPAYLALVTDEGDAINGVALNADGSAKNVGYAMFLPTPTADTDEVLNLKVITAQNGDYEDVLVPAKKFLPSYAYKLTLKLTETGLQAEEVEFDSDENDIDGWLDGTDPADFELP